MTKKGKRATDLKVKLSSANSAGGKLERDVLDWINSKAEDYTNGAAGVLKDLAYGGCSSGMVSHLVYTEDGAKFYDEHQKAIDAMLYEILSDTGSTPDKLFGDNWDAADPLARDAANKCVLAWFGFEETARMLGERAGIEL